MPNTDRYNDEPIALKEGTVYLDGKELFDACKFTLTAHLDTWTGKTLGSKGKRSTRILGVTFDGAITERRNTPWTRELVERIKNGETPELTVQGRIADEGSRYYKEYGAETVTAVGCVPTGDIQLLNIDVDSTDVLNDEIGFNAYDVLF